MRRLLILLFFSVSFSYGLPAFAEEYSGPRIALIMKALSNPFFLEMEAGAKEYANSNNIQLDVFGVEYETDVAKQVGLVEHIISLNYDALVIAPADSVKLIPVLKKAQNKGIVVVNIDNPLDKLALKKQGLTIPFVGSDNKRGAQMVGDYIFGLLKEAHPDQKKRFSVILVEGIRGARNAELRKEGFLESISRANAKLIASDSANWHMEDAYVLVGQLLDEHGAVDAVLCANDQMALGALQALSERGFGGKTLVGGYDNIEAVRMSMRHKSIHATMEQNPRTMGSEGVALAVFGAQGDSLPKYVPTPLNLIAYHDFTKVVGLSVSTMHNPFFQKMVTSVRRLADTYGVKLLVSDANNDDAKQLADIEGFVEKKADIIIVNPTNSQTIVPGIEYANAAGIPVITVDREAAMGVVASHIGSDNKGGGRMAAAFMLKTLPRGARIVEIEGIPGTSAAIDRGSGFNEVLARSKLTVVERLPGHFDRESARRVFSEWLASGKKADAVFAHNDSMALGVYDAIQDTQHDGKLIIVGYDGISEILQLITQGKIAATIAQQPGKMGQKAMSSAMELLHRAPVPPTSAVPLRLITE